MAWPEFLERFGAIWLEPGSPLALASREDFVAEFIGPNMLWQRDWSDELLKKGTLPASSRLLRRVQKRLMWQAFSDFTYQSQRGRTLERIGKAVLTVRKAGGEPLACFTLTVENARLVQQRIRGARPRRHRTAPTPH